jgi:hypothetical protein
MAPCEKRYYGSAFEEVAARALQNQKHADAIRAQL